MLFARLRAKRRSHRAPPQRDRRAVDSLLRAPRPLQQRETSAGRPAPSPFPLDSDTSGVNGSGTSAVSTGLAGAPDPVTFVRMGARERAYSTVTLFARLRGWSTSVPFWTAT